MSSSSAKPPGLSAVPWGRGVRCALTVTVEAVPSQARQHCYLRRFLQAGPGQAQGRWDLGVCDLVGWGWSSLSGVGGWGAGSSITRWPQLGHGTLPCLTFSLRIKGLGAKSLGAKRT